MFRIACIGDIHIGAVPADVLRHELRTQFLDVLEIIKPDMVVIAGDLIDHKLSFNSEDSKLAVEFVEELSNKYILRILKGTKTHDLNQLNNFSYLQTKEDLDVRIFNVINREEIDGKKFLYLPEEYLENYFDDYKEFLCEEYDAIFFHGTWNFAGYVNKIQESERPIKHAPLFKYEDFKDKAKIIMGGHIHTGDSYKDKVFYTGSFSRWCMGEENDKGFRVIDFDDEENTVTQRFVVNTLARKFITIDVNEIVEREDLTIEEKIKLIESYKNDKDIFKLRVKYDNTEENNLQTTIIRDYFSTDSVINVSVSNNINDKKTEEEQKITKEYDFIFNRDYDMATTISMYLEKHDGIELSKDIISELLLEEE